MQITDPVADMLTRIRNANTAKHESVDVPASNLKKAIAQILLDEGYIKAYEIVDDGTQGIIRITGENFQRLAEPRGRIHAADEISVIRRAEANIRLLNFPPGKQEMQLAERRIAARREEQKRGSNRNHHRKTTSLQQIVKAKRADVKALGVRFAFLF